MLSQIGYLKDRAVCISHYGFMSKGGSLGMSGFAFYRLTQSYKDKAKKWQL